MTEQERLEQQRKRLQQNVEKARSGGRDLRPGILNLDVIGGYRKDLFYTPKINPSTKEGQNKIDILPYIVKTNNHPQGVKPGVDDYILDVWVHNRIGPKEGTYVCLKETYHEPCPICEEREVLMKDPTISKEEIEKLKPQHKVYYNVIDLDLPQDQQKVQIFSTSYAFFEKELAAEAARGELIIYYNIEHGKSINMRVTEEVFGTRKYYKYKRFDFESRKPYTNDIYKYTYALDELLVKLSYEELRNISIGCDDDEIVASGPVVSSFRKEEPVGQIHQTALPPRGEAPRDSAPVQSEPPRRERVRDRSVPSPIQDKCTSGLKFGIDSDLKPECQKCPDALWKECTAEYDKTH